MTHFAGLDVSLEETAICVVDATVRILKETRAASEPCAPSAALTALGLPLDLSAIGRTLQVGLILRLSKDDPVDLPMIVDEADQGRDRRSNSAKARYVLALRRISLARRSSRFSRSSALIRSRSSVVCPGRTP